MSLIHPNSLDYTQYNFVTPDYQLTKLIQQTGGQVNTITTSGGTESIFELPAKVFNFGKSFISFSISIPDTGANTTYNWFQTNVIPFWQQIQVYTKGGLFLCDLISAHNYSNLVNPIETKIENLKTYDQYVAAQAGTGYGQCFRIQGGSAANYRPNGVEPDNGTDELQYTFVSTAGGAGAGGLTANFIIPFSMFKNTIMGLNKDLYFNGEIMMIRFVWGPATKLYFKSTAANAPQTNATAAALSASVSNIALYLALENNQEIVNQIMSKCSSPDGLKVLVPFVWTNRINLTGNSQTITLRYTAAQGLRLKKIYHGVYANVESANTMYEHNNTAGAVVTSYYTMLDNVRRQQFNVNCTIGEDYILNKDKIKGSTLITSDTYYYNWCFPGKNNNIIPIFIKYYIVITTICIQYIFNIN